MNGRRCQGKVLYSDLLPFLAILRNKLQPWSSFFVQVHCATWCTRLLHKSLSCSRELLNAFWEKYLDHRTAVVSSNAIDIYNLYDGSSQSEGRHWHLDELNDTTALRLSKFFALLLGANLASSATKDVQSRENIATFRKSEIQEMKPMKQYVNSSFNF